jgi:hypothetical protein
MHPTVCCCFAGRAQQSMPWGANGQAHLQAAALDRQRWLEAAAAAATERQRIKQQQFDTRLAGAGAAADAAGGRPDLISDQWNRDGPLLQQLLLPPLKGLPSYTNDADPMPAYIKAAMDFRTCVDARVQKGLAICCVCARYLPLVTKDKGSTLASTQQPWQEVPAGRLPGKELLLMADCLGSTADGEAVAAHTPELPRVGLTTCSIDGKTYCLESAGIATVNGEAELVHISHRHTG